MVKKNNQRKPQEKDAVFTTIVGGRPPGSGTNVSNIPRGIEVLVKKASVDKEFCKILLEKRAEAAVGIDLDLSEEEKAILRSIPKEQLEKIILETKVRPENKSIFLGNVGKIMLAAVAGFAVITAMCPTLGHTVAPDVTGIRPDRVDELRLEAPNDPNSQDKDTTSDPNTPDINDFDSAIRGIRPDRPKTNKD